MDNVNQFSRTGTVLPSRATKYSQVLAKYAMEKLNEAYTFHVDFDCTHNNGGTYSIHEFCGALGGISLRYMDFDIHMQVLTEAVDMFPTNFQSFTDKICELDDIDKYSLRSTNLQFDQIIFLSGSNLLHINMDFDKIAEAVKQGAVLKPHPVTHARDLDFLKSEFGKENVLAPKVAGGQLLRNAKKIYVAKNSEIWFAAVAMDITVDDIGKAGFVAEVYRPAIDVVTENMVYLPKVAMNRLFSSPLSGLYFSKEDIDRDMGKYVERIEQLRKSE